MGATIMTTIAVLEIIAVSLVCSLVIGVAGLLLARRTRTWSLRWHIVLLVAIAIGGTYAGILAIAALMFVSEHDLLVETVVSSTSAVMAFAIAVIAGDLISTWSSAIRRQVKDLQLDDSTSLTQPDGPREFRDLANELAITKERLALARQRELQLEESRRELVSWVSHDLRTPLAGLLAMAEALQDGLADDPARFHAMMRDEVHRMTALVDDLFELSRIHAGVLKISPRTLSLEDLVSDAIAAARPVATKHGVTVDGHVDAGLEVTADSAGISRALSNLIMNAVRHTPAHGSVYVTGRSTEGSVELQVMDQCGGLTQHEMSRVFDLGWQGTNSRATGGQVGSTAGAGLGLAIVKGIVEAHQGEVLVTNRPEDEGCSFSIVMPAESGAVC